MTREEFISMMGYRDDSPFREFDEHNIKVGDNGLIDMTNTGIPLMANGRYLPPYSGHHQFKPNSIVTETPVAKQGGQLPKFQTQGGFDEEGNYIGFPNMFDANGNYVPFQVNTSDYSTTNPSGQRSTEMDDIDEFFRGSLNSPIYKKRLGLQGSIRDLGTGDGRERIWFHPDHGTVSQKEAEKLGIDYGDDNWQQLRVSLPFQTWDSDEKNTLNQTKVDETVTNRLNALNTMTTDYSSEYDNRLYEKSKKTETHTTSPGIIFLAYISDVEDGEFQYIKGSHI